MHIVYRAENLLDAQLVKDAIEAEGFPAFVIGAALSGGIGELPVMGLVSVAVPDTAAPEVDARLPAILKDLCLAAAASSMPHPGDGNDANLTDGMLPNRT